MTDHAAHEIKGKLVDIGGNLNFADEHGNFNTMSGPMNDEQISKFFPWREKEDVPKIGLYYDIDYWIRPSKELSDAELLRTISTFAKEVWSKLEGIRRVILGG